MEDSLISELKFKSHTQKTMAPQSNVGRRDELYEAILRKISEADQQNKRLILISETIDKSSFASSKQRMDIIIGFEREIKLGFNEIRNSLRQYFIDIDSKLKNIGIALENEFGFNTVSFKEEVANECEAHINQINILEKKVTELQEKETNLIQIIGYLSSKNCSEEPTLVKITEVQNRPINNQSFNQEAPSLAFSRASSNFNLVQERSFRIFSKLPEAQLISRTGSNNHIISPQIVSPERKATTFGTLNFPIRTCFAEENTPQETEFFPKPVFSSKRSLKLKVNSEEHLNRSHRLNFLKNELRN